MPVAKNLGIRVMPIDPNDAKPFIERTGTPDSPSTTMVPCGVGKHIELAELDPKTKKPKCTSTIVVDIKYCCRDAYVGFGPSTLVDPLDAMQ